MAKDKTLIVRVDEQMKTRLEKYVAINEIDISKLVVKLLNEELEQSAALAKEADLIIETMSTGYDKFQNTRDYREQFEEQLNNEELEFFEALDFCMQVLARTKLIDNKRNYNYVPELIDPYEDINSDGMVYKYAIVTNKIADQVIEKINVKIVKGNE